MDHKLLSKHAPTHIWNSLLPQHLDEDLPQYSNNDFLHSNEDEVDSNEGHDFGGWKDPCTRGRRGRKKNRIKETTPRVLSFHLLILHLFISMPKMNRKSWKDHGGSMEVKKNLLHHLEAPIRVQEKELLHQFFYQFSH